MRILFLLALATAALSACSDDDNGTAPMIDARPQTPDAPPGQATLVDFVTDLVANHTDETSAPVSIEGLDLAGTEDPAAFDQLFQP